MLAPPDSDPPGESGGSLMNSIRDLEEMIARMLEEARKLPAGDVRYSTLKEIGRFRVRLDAVAARQTPPAE
jgi:hypothetical protein